METPAALNNATANHVTPRKTVVVFGAAWATPTSALYEESVRLGRQLATQGFKLVNGGYGGTMEGSAKGAADVPGSIREGVVVRALFPARPHGNEYLTHTVDTATLTARIEAMVVQADYFVVMPGTLGTLTELCIVWNIAALAPLSGARPPVILAYRTPWEAVTSSLALQLALPAEHRAKLRFVSDAEDVVNELVLDWQARTPVATVAS